MVIVARRKRETLVPVLFYYYDDAEAPRWRSWPCSTRSYTNTEVVGEPLLPESWLAEQASGASTRRKGRAAYLQLSHRELSTEIYGCALSGPLSLVYFPLLCALTHELISGEHFALWQRLVGLSFPWVGLSPWGFIWSSSVGYLRKCCPIL